MSTKQTKVGRHAAPQTDAAGRSGSFVKELIDISASHFMDNESATEREARETAETAVRVGYKAKDKTDFWLRAVYGTLLTWFLVGIGLALVPAHQALQQLLIALPFVAAITLLMKQPSVVTGSLAWDKTSPLARRLLALSAYQITWGLVIYALPLHNQRQLVLPFVVVLLLIGLFKLSGQKSAIPTLLWIAAAIMALIFLFSGISMPSVEGSNGQFMGYTSGAPTSPAPSPATSPKATQAPAPSADRPEPAVHPVPEPEAILGPRSDVSPDYVEPGSLVHSTIVVDNVSSVEARNVHVTIELAQGLVFADTGLRVREVDLGNIPGHGEVPINSTIQVAEDAPAGGYDNWVHVRADNYPGISVPHALTVVQN